MQTCVGPSAGCSISAAISRWTIRELALEVARRIDPRISLKFLPYAEAYGNDFEDVRRRVPDLTRLTETLGDKPSAAARRRFSTTSSATRKRCFERRGQARRDTVSAPRVFLSLEASPLYRQDSGESPTRSAGRH